MNSPLKLTLISPSCSISLSFRLSAILSLILLASTMAFRSPSPSPRSAGPRHSGLRMRRRMTRFAFSSTLSPLTYLKKIYVIRQISEICLWSHIMFLEHVLKNRSFAFVASTLTLHYSPCYSGVLLKIATSVIEPDCP